MRFSEQIEVSRPAADAFRYIAEFENTAQWDPGIAESRKLTDGPVRIGSQFDVVALFRGKRQRFRYTVTELDDGRRIVLEGDGEKATSADAITVEPAGGGSRISYTADVRLKGLRRIAEPLLKPMLRKTGEDALAGLKLELDRPA
ncbi:MAG: SRPBCC family protein [Actinobacteria bacterium]|nr:SRPBCC family protein [Actinomycetota bacterium]